MFSHAVARCLCMQIMLCILLCLSACSLRPVRVVQEDHFKTMCAHLGPEMLRRALLDEQCNYMSSPLSALRFRKDSGEILFQRLSPAFRYPADTPMAIPGSFAESAASRRTAQISDYGFILTQGLDTVELNLIAQSDWDGDGQKEWLLACKVTSGGAPLSRTYYLALPDLDAEGALNARVLAVFECLAYDCTLHVPQAGTTSYEPEAPLIESMPGQRVITHPPAHPPAVKKPASDAPKKRLP